MAAEGVAPILVYDAYGWGAAEAVKLYSSLGLAALATNSALTIIPLANLISHARLNAVCLAIGAIGGAFIIAFPGVAESPTPPFQYVMGSSVMAMATQMRTNLHQVIIASKTSKDIRVRAQVTANSGNSLGRIAGPIFSSCVYSILRANTSAAVAINLAAFLPCPLFLASFIGPTCMGVYDSEKERVIQL